MEKTDLKSLDQAELAALLSRMGEPRYRGKQLFEWLHKKRAQSFREMTTLPGTLRETLEASCAITALEPLKTQVSAADGTVKYLFGLPDGNAVETVLMSHRHGDSLCVSTQAGCRMGCAFCASTIGGLARNLAASEMLEQVYEAGRQSGRRIGSVVLMGIGEPLDNFIPVTRFLALLSDSDGLGMSLRHVSLSTCGLVDKIDLLAEKRLPLTLSVSLHAPNDEIRDRIMPINRKWNIGELLGSCRRYFEKTGRRVSFEYALIDGLNDRDIHARELAGRLRGPGCHVNLIPVNPVRERGFARSRRENTGRFLEILQKAGVTATVRRPLGNDISAACGQLRRESASVV